MQKCIRHRPSHPRLTVADNKHRRRQPISIFNVADFTVERHATIAHPDTHDDQVEEETDEIFVILIADTIAYPGTVMI